MNPFNNDSHIKQDHVFPTQLEKRKYLTEIIHDSTHVHYDDKINNIGLYIKTGNLSHILFMDEMYQLIKDVPGVIMEFGVWYGQNLVLFENLRAIYEPFNKMRRIIGFDTFTGYPETSKTLGDDNAKEYLDEGIYKLNDDYFDFLNNTLIFHQENNVLGHLKTHELIKGKVEDTLPVFIEKNKSMSVALIYLDLALVASTKCVLENLKKYFVKGSVIMFDEFNHNKIAGDTIAFREVFVEWNINYEIKLSKFMKHKTFVIIK